MLKFRVSRKKFLKAGAGGDMPQPTPRKRDETRDAFIASIPVPSVRIPPIKQWKKEKLLHLDFSLLLHWLFLCICDVCAQEKKISNRFL